MKRPPHAFALDAMSCASALGRDNAAALASLRDRRAPGMREVAGDVPGRPLWFGSVPGELPAVAPGGLDMRANRLLELALANAGGAFERAVAECGGARAAVVLGVSNTGVDEAQRLIDRWLDGGAPPAPREFSLLELGAPAEYLARRLGVAGPAYSVSTACSSAAKAFAAAARLIDAGAADLVVTGGVDGRCRFAMNGFNALGALAAGRCRPLAPDRDGINLGEGVALFLLRRAHPAARVLFAGAGECSDAYHPTAPDPSGAGAARAMREALAAAALEPDDVDYLNLHGTGTPANDSMETAAVRAVFGDSPRALVESTKDLTGHCLGAAGAVEAAICWLRIDAGLSRVALSNSFAFGGSDAAVAFTAGALP